MAFKNLPDQRYYLVAKHSGKALGFKNDSKGATLTQMTLDPDNENQKFTLAEGPHFFWIMPRKNERYLAVNNSSHDNRAAFIQWHWEPGKENHQFHLDPAGDGYYRIRVLHSNKFIDVILGRKEDDAEVGQFQLSGTDNQLFKLVPVAYDPVGGSAVSYVEHNELLRMMVLGCISAGAPNGGAVSAIIGFLWSSNNTLSDVWDQMKSYVDSRIAQVMEHSMLSGLRDDLTGILKNASTFDGMSDGENDKGIQLISTLVLAEGRRPHFFNKQPAVLPYLIGLGSLMIALYRRLVVDYELIFGRKPSAKDAAQHLTDLKDCIEKFSKEVEKHTKSLKQSRMSHIQPAQESANLYEPACTAKDTFDNWTMTFYPAVEGSKGAYMPTTINAVDQRRKQIKEQYESELDEITAQTKVWKYLNPDEKGQYGRSKKKRAVGSFGGIMNTHAFSGLENTVIKSITVYYDKDELTGIALGYEGKTGVTAGKVTSTYIEQELKDDYITSVYGYMYKHIQGIWFTTMKGHVIGAGKKNKTPFSADLADGLNARLVNITGSHNDALLEKLTFHWEYTY
ncbi:Jacalin-like lectin domain-containing protein [Chitinophaga sp. YR627]|uniref:RICIN domain-containing protein n=1 Tax=Chitinophaga sp. YR627 TaxID=1881041 RepID=UPI0008E7BD27|nr:RICIN domain-containing protein [Chitinophaga sp. YR627]SFM63176.1 Jacalin-like lectin domain-containing protein [Chitinophaga sp. YR627]